MSMKTFRLKNAISLGIFLLPDTEAMIQAQTQSTYMY